MRRLIRMVKVSAAAALAGVVAVLLIRRWSESAETERVRFAAVLERREVRWPAADVSGGGLVVIAGTGRLDLRRVRLGGRSARLRAVIVGGTVELTVPDTWIVTVAGRTETVSADVADPRTLPPDAPSLQLTARVLGGHLDVVARPVLKPAHRLA